MRYLYPRGHNSAVASGTDVTYRADALMQWRNITITMISILQVKQIVGIVGGFFLSCGSVNSKKCMESDLLRLDSSHFTKTFRMGMLSLLSRE